MFANFNLILITVHVLVAAPAHSPTWMGPTVPFNFHCSRPSGYGSSDVWIPFPYYLPGGIGTMALPSGAPPASLFSASPQSALSQRFPLPPISFLQTIQRRFSPSKSPQSLTHGPSPSVGQAALPHTSFTRHSDTEDCDVANEDFALP